MCEPFLPVMAMTAMPEMQGTPIKIIVADAELTVI